MTEEGFDIPECNTVISFDTPSSLKSYIQIKGRARKLHSKYYIFTSVKNYDKMLKNREIFDDTINITYEIAINQLAKKGELPTEPYKPDKGYKMITIKNTGAIINTNFAM